ncbi:SKP1-like protein 21 isoform X1 [Cryptomeria japonica]|uniref:SKP1-like protein 21 isoform X1 n=1 Tax=Cryptomeria japonica TaxID=3369 RepID=UPI0025AB8D4C|nr:SKP1-like protein 21 isoform X1 [Cryptomeria japonica]XP_059075835.1 SKP1-like protein 21 isoform X1 [Cryptomeria japonica]XP_059075836.1 SKP1-like protein 21 isoform X1 [Cryptomeria japonica]
MSDSVIAISKHEEENHLMLNATKSMLPGSSLQGAKSFVWLQTADGSIQEVEQEVVMLCPLICREILQKGLGSSKSFAIILPSQVNSSILRQILEYCRFHQVLGRSNKERKLFDEKFIRLDTKRLCELTSAADSLQMKPLVDLTSRALARMIEGKTPEEIRETFHLPDDLTEEEKLEPLKNTTDDPRIRLLNRLYARKRKELKEKAKLKNIEAEEEHADERSVEDLLLFINGSDGDSKGSKGGKGKKKKNRKKKEQAKDGISGSVNGVPLKVDSGAISPDQNGEFQNIIIASNTNNICGIEEVSDERFSGDFDDADNDDELDPIMREKLDRSYYCREVEDFARRLNSDWPERMQEILASGQDQRKNLPSSLSSDSSIKRFANKGKLGRGHHRSIKMLLLLAIS